MKFALVTTNANMATIADEILCEKSMIGIQLVFHQIKRVSDVDSLELDCDGVISRGLVYYALQQRVGKTIPLVELVITGYDVVNALHRCKQASRANKIGVAGTMSLVEGAQSVAESLGMRLCCQAVETEGDIHEFLCHSKELGFDVIAGGSTVVNMAGGFDVKGVLIESGKASLRQAMDEAKRTVAVALRERALAEQTKTIMNSLSEGMIAVDNNGVVTSINTAGCTMLGFEDNAPLGKKIAEAFPGSGLPKLLAGGCKELGALSRGKHGALVENLSPIVVDGELMGGVSLFQTVSNLQEVEGHVRTTMHQKRLTARYTFDRCLGTSDAIKETILKAIKFSSVDANLILLGETGTGKEVFAQSIHNASRRRNNPFVAINCAALPENLLESELFGYVKGAFTGASPSGKAGFFELANNGTLFLDEVSEIPIALQGRLLRVLQEHEVMRLGHDRIIPVNVRVIAASNKSLRAMSEKGLFRKDLLYRLDTLEIAIPPLRERRDDTTILAEAFLEEAARRLGCHQVRLSPGAVMALRAHRWPGNIRELLNVCERIMILSASHRVDATEVELALGGYAESSPEESERMPPTTIEEVTRQKIMDMLAKTNGNKARAAKLLGISRTTLWRKLGCRQQADDPARD